MVAPLESQNGQNRVVKNVRQNKEQYEGVEKVEEEKAFYSVGLFRY